jgi:hypothetical protein
VDDRLEGPTGRGQTVEVVQGQKYRDLLQQYKFWKVADKAPLTVEAGGPRRFAEGLDQLFQANLNGLKPSPFIFLANFH